MFTIVHKLAFSKLPFASFPRWVTWRYESLRPDGKRQKVPCSALTLKSADITDSKNWVTLEEALAALDKRNFDGIGFVLGAGWVGIDLDDCCDRETGEVEPWAAAIIERFPRFYWEISPSGAGLHGIGRGRLQSSACRRGQIEIYAKDRFFTVTGNALNEGTDEDCSDELNTWHREVFGVDTAQEEEGETEATAVSYALAPHLRLSDEEVIARACRAKNAAKFKRLFFAGDTSEYKSASEADLALISLLIFWSRGDRAQADRLFRKSKLYRSKWDEKHGTETYGERTLTRARRGSFIYARLARFYSAIASATWIGLAENNALNILLVLIEQAGRNGTFSVQVSQRFLADRAHVSKRATVVRALRLLEANGWLTIATSQSVSAASTYTLSLPATVSRRGQRDNSTPPVFSSWAFLETHDVWRTKELGTTGRRVYAVLSNCPRSAAEVMSLSGVRKATCFRKLAKMQDLGLSVRTSKGWVLGPSTLEYAAQKCRSAGKDKAQIAAHRKESVEFKRPRKTLKMVPVDVAAAENEPPALVWFDDTHRRSTDEIRIAASLKKYSRAA